MSPRRSGRAAGRAARPRVGASAALLSAALLVAGGAGAGFAASASGDPGATGAQGAPGVPAVAGVPAAGGTTAVRADRADGGGSGTARERGGGEPAALDVLALPTVVKRWSRKIPADRLAVRRDAVYARSGARLSALAVRSGRELWSRQLGDFSCCGDDIVLAGSTVVGDADGKLLLVDAADGSLRGEVDLGAIAAYAGPPVVALSGAGDELVAVDPASSQVTARVPLGEAVLHLGVEDGYALLALAGPGGEGRLTVAGLSADGLREVWRREEPGGDAPAWVEVLGGKLHLARRDRAESSEVVPIEPASGRLGRPLRLAPGVQMAAAWPAGLQALTGAAGGAGAGAEAGGSPAQALRRLAPGSGRPLWTTQLPCKIDGATQEGSVLAAACTRGDGAHGRGLLAILSWESGEIRQLAYGMPAVSDLALAGDLVLAATGEEVAAFSTIEFGMPEGEGSIAAAVRRILLDTRGDQAPDDRGGFILDRLSELEPLGPAAYPFIVRLLPRLGPTSVVAAAGALAAGGYRPAAPALARQLRPGGLEEPRPGAAFKGWNPRFALLRALAVLGGDAEAPAVAGWLGAPGKAAQTGAVRREALATLVAMRSPAADEVVRAFLAAPPSRQPVWNPPRPPAVGAGDGADAAGGGDGEGTAGGGSILVQLPEGRRLVLFRDGYLGSPDDLWAADLGADGRAARPARFTGVRLQLDDDEQRLVDLRGRVAGDRVSVRDAAGRELAAFSLAGAARDSDGDGLTDVVERRLRLDPGNPDTDGDGLRDAEDPAPNARLREPRDDEQAIAAAIFRQFFQFEDGIDGPAAGVAVMVSDFALEWRGRRDPTITLDAREAARFREEIGGGSALLIGIRRGEPGGELGGGPALQLTGDPPAPLPPPAAGEEVYTLTLDRGRFHTHVYRVVVRNLNAAQPAAPRLWAVSWLRLVWSD
jgi:hypothetical protein